MKKPEPQVGLVIRYDFLWSHERDRGYQEGAKTRPCVIVTAVVRKAGGETEVLVAPVTHSPPGKDVVVVEIPHAVGRSLGLDDDRSYIVASEANSLAWDDPGIVPAVPGDRWAYGRLPRGLYERLRGEMLELARRRKLRPADRKT